MNKIWMFFFLSLMLVLTSCDDVYNRKIALVYAGHDTPVTVFNAEGASIGTLPSKTEVIPSDNQENVPSGYVRLSAPKANVLVAAKDVHYKKVKVLRGSNGTFTRLPTFPEKLSQAGAPLSAKLFEAVDELHFQKHDYNGILWSIILILSALVGWGLMAFATDSDVYLVGLLGVALMVLSYFSGFVLFGIQEPFEDGLKSNCGWFVDLLFFIGIVVAAFLMFSTFSSTMALIIPYTMDSSSDFLLPSINTFVQGFLLMVYAVCLWLAKGVADYVLWAMIIVQACVSLYVIFISFRSGIFLPPLLYTVVFPLSFIFMAVTVLTVGWMVFVLALLLVAGGSLLTAPGTTDGEVVGIRVTDGMGITLFEDRWK